MAGTSAATTNAEGGAQPSSRTNGEAEKAAATGSVGANNGDSSSTSISSSSNNNNGGASADDVERLTKLGVLLVNVGAASEEKVFGVKNSAAMQTYRDHRMSDLLVINRSEDDAAAHPLCWYKPWTWWTSGRQVSPILRVPASAASTVTAGQSSTSTGAATTTATGASQTNAAHVETLPAAEPHVKPRKKAGLPTVNMRPLTDDEVAVLTPAVQEDRGKLLKAEEHIHKMLQNIEDTRYRYLVPSRDLHCEAEVVAVVRCYAERQQAAAALKAKNGVAAGGVDGIPAEGAVVRSDLLACGPSVQQLKKCAEAMAMAYSHDGEVA
jgi:hypothetical protein